MVSASERLLDASRALSAAADALDDLVRTRSGGRRPWTPAEDQLVRDFYPEVPTRLLAILLHRGASAVYQRARTLEVGKSEAFLASPLSGRTGHDDRGRAGRFRKGLRPWNAGRKGWQAGGRAAETQFRPGHRPSNWKPIGHERRCRDGYLWRKVRDGSSPSTYNYEPVHKLLWEEAHGPIPEGHAVAFNNGNKNDLRVENLELVTRGELMRRNTRHRYPKDINRAIAAKAALTRRINKLEKRA